MKPQDLPALIAVPVAAHKGRRPGQSVIRRRPRRPSYATTVAMQVFFSLEDDLY